MPVKKKKIGKKAKAIQSITETITETSWDDFGRTERPHFRNYKDWVAKVKEWGVENRIRHYVCEDCEGIYINFLPECTCQGTKDNNTICNNDDMEKFKEITGPMKDYLISGGSLKELIRNYSYT